MAKVYQAFTASMGAAVLTLGLVTTGAWGQGGGAAPMAGGGTAGMGELEGALTVKGSVVCVDCTLEEARAAHPDVTDFYQLTHATPGAGRLVMKVDDVNNKMWWETLVGLTHQVPVRAEERIWQGLTAEENLFKDMQIVGLLRKSRTLDIAEVNVGDLTLTELENTHIHRQAIAAGLKAQNAAMRAQTAALRAETAALRAETAAEQTERTVQRMEMMVTKWNGQRASL